MQDSQMSGQGVAKVWVVGRIQSLFGQPGSPPLFITVGKGEGYAPTLYLQPESPRSQMWCFVRPGDESPSPGKNGYYICSYPDLEHYLRLSAHDVNPLDSEAFSQLEVVQLPSRLTDGGPLPELGCSAKFMLLKAQNVASFPSPISSSFPSPSSAGDERASGYYFISCAADKMTGPAPLLLQAGTREAEPCSGMRVCAHSRKGCLRELWVLENDKV